MKYFYRLLVSAAFSLPLACNDKEPKPECFSFNDTTISITREVNGRAPFFNELNKQDQTQIIGESALDLVNETHNLGTEPLPMDTNLTRVPRYCVDPGVAYSYFGEDYTRGIYFAVDVEPLQAIENLNHEIGHLQPGGQNNEVVADLNEFEQKMMAYALFAASKEKDIIQWAYHNAEMDGFLGHLTTAVEKDWSVIDDRLIPYTKADMFILIKLLDPSTNFRSLRDQIIASQTQEGTLEYNLEQAAGDFAHRFNPTKYNSKQAQRADVILSLVSAAARELDHRFGQEIAQRYMDAHSYFPYEQERKRPVIGLEERVCSLIAAHSDPEQQYCPVQDLPEGIVCEKSIGMDLCCIQLTNHQIRRSQVQVQGASLISQRTSHIIWKDIAWEGIDVVGVTTEERVPEDTPCK